MKTIQLTLLLFCSALLLLNTQCKKSHTSPPLTELQKLPAVMQGGLNTFGCLINGKAFVPGGGGILSNTLSVQYDPKFQGGKLSIVARNYPDATNFYGVGILGDSIKTTGTFSLQLHSKYVITYVDTRVNCNFHTYYDMPIAGELIITRFDTITRIISGTFTFKVTTSSCGIIDGTEGRFDVKY